MWYIDDSYALPRVLDRTLVQVHKQAKILGIASGGGHNLCGYVSEYDVVGREDADEVVLSPEEQTSQQQQQQPEEVFGAVRSHE